MRNIWMTAVSLIFLSLSELQLAAQGGGANLNNNNVVGWNNVPVNLGKETVSYGDVKGNCFWNKEWLPAHFVMENGTKFRLPKAKLNCYSNEIHYLNENGNELAFHNGIKSIDFYSPTDISKIATFRSLGESNVKGQEVYAEVLVDGKTQLLKKLLVKLVKLETDPLLAKQEWTFIPRETYFVSENGATHEMKGISKNHLFAVIKKVDGDEEWLSAQKNKLRNENDVISFLTFRNSAK